MRNIIGRSEISAFKHLTLYVYRKTTSTNFYIQKKNLKSNMNIKTLIRSTVKAPNFDRVFMKNIFFLHIFVG